MAHLQGFQYYVPPTCRTNEDLVRLNPEWNAESILTTTGIQSRRVAAEDETAVDLGYRAARRLLEEIHRDRSTIDALLFCTRSPHYPIPASACLLHARLALPASCAAFSWAMTELQWGGPAR